jgi:hypothetical protein
MKGIFTEEEKQHPSKNSTEFEVEFIYAHRQFPDRKRGRDDTKSGLQYRVKWTGNDRRYDRWISESHMNCTDLIKKYWNDVRNAGQNKNVG